MPRIRCHYQDCVFLDENYCGAAAVEIDPDVGCMTYSRINDIDNDDDWEDEDEAQEDWEDLEDEDDDEDIWLDDDDF